MKHVSDGSPAAATTSPARTATAWTRCTASTTPLRRTSTTIGRLTRATICALANGRLMPYVRDMPTVDGHDYEAEDTMLVSDPAQLRAMADPFRTGLIQLMRVRARLTKKDMDRFERRAKKLMDDFRAADRAGGVPSSLTAGIWAAEAEDA